MAALYPPWMQAIARDIGSCWVEDGGVTDASFVQEYLHALAAGDVPRVLRLFAENAVVHSPLYGDLPATKFYPELFEDTAESSLWLRTTLVGERGGHPTVAFWFDFDWILASGEPAPFSVVDIAELDDDGKITELHIVYDTAPIRESFQNQQAARKNL